MLVERLCSEAFVALRSTGALIGLDPADGRPLLARYDIEKAARTLTVDSLAKRRTGGLWRWAEVLPVRDQDHIVYLGEGDTPLLAQPRLGEALGVPRLAEPWLRQERRIAL